LLVDRQVQPQRLDGIAKALLVAVRIDQDIDRIADDVDAEEHEHRHREHDDAALQDAADDEDRHALPPALMATIRISATQAPDVADRRPDAV
jgi:hypothetical protein